MRKLRDYSFILILFSISMYSCEEEISPEDTNSNPKFVVESYIELGNEALPTYALITKTLGFYSKFSQADLLQSFISGASVKILHNSDTVKLQEVCFASLTPDLKESVAKVLGIDVDSIKLDICVYVDILNSIKPQIGNTYEINVQVDQTVLSGKTSMPNLVPIDSFWFEPTPGKALDSFLQLFCTISDLPNEKNFYRYFVATGDGTFKANFQSVTDDAFFDGKEFKFTLQNAQSQDDDFNESYGYFKKGDTITLKWCNLDEAHFNFWNTLEVSRTRQGPFANYVRIESNIKNGLGIFGAYHCKNYKLAIPK